VSGQKTPNQKSMTYILWRGQRRQAQSEWTEGPRSEINDLHAVEGQRRQAQGEWTEGPRSEINDLHAVDEPEKASSG